MGRACWRGIEDGIMKRLVVLALLLASMPALAAPAAAAPPAPPLLTGARVLDPSGDHLLDGRDVLIENGRIAAVGPTGSLSVPAGTRKVDLAGLTLIPGLIEMHSHLLLHPYDETPWDDQVLKEPLELRTIRAVVAAKATLEAGFTTVRDLGTEGAGFADVALRDAIAQRMIPGPRVLAATRAIVATGSYGPAGFDPRWDVPKGAQVVDGPIEMRKAVRQQIAAGADWIKVYADYRRRPGITTPTLTQEEMAAAVDEARSAGLLVAAHAYTEEGIRRAVAAGVKTIEHGTNVTDELLALMKQKGVALVPTLAATDAVSRYAGWKPGEPEPPRVKETREMFARALKSGVTIANGSDVGVFAHGKHARELELMVAYGMSPAQALPAATITAAAVLRKEHELGRIAPGYFADLVAVKGNPLADIAVIEQPVVVLKEGQIALDRR